MLLFIVNVLKRVWTGLSFLCFKPKEVGFKVSLITLYYFSVMFDFMWAITLDASGTMHIICESSVSLFLAVLALVNARIHTILRIPNVNLNNSHIRFRRGFDDENMKQV